MGFIPSSSTISLKAYLTQKGREYLINGNKEDVTVAFFGLSDDDVDYRISGNIATNEFHNADYNILPMGFVPDLTGDNTGCIKSVAAGQRIRNFLKGSTVRNTIGTIGTGGVIGGRIVSIGFQSNTVNVSMGTSKDVTQTVIVKIINGNGVSPNKYADITFRVVLQSLSINNQNVAFNNDTLRVNVPNIEQNFRRDGGSPTPSVPVNISIKRITTTIQTNTPFEAILKLEQVRGIYTIGADTFTLTGTFSVAQVSAQNTIQNNLLLNSIAGNSNNNNNNNNNNAQFNPL